MTRRCSSASSVNTSRFGHVRPHARSVCGAGVASEVFESGTEPFSPTRSYAMSPPPPSRGHMWPPLTRREATCGPPKPTRLRAHAAATGLSTVRRRPNVASRRWRGGRTWPLDGGGAAERGLSTVRRRPNVASRRSGGGRCGGRVGVGRSDGGGEDAGVEAGAVAGVAGRADLVDRDEQRVPVAVEAHRLHPLDVAARVALAPVLLPAARPERHPALPERAAQGLVVHPADHEDVAGVVLLHDGSDESVLVALEQSGDLRVEGGRVGDRVAGVGHPDILPWTPQTACCWATHDSCSFE